MDPPDLSRAFGVNSQLAPSPVIDETSGETYSHSTGENTQLIYAAVYSAVPVFEMMIRGIGVMRRRSDSYMNATQILKVAGVEKGKRTKILDKEVALGVHEKVQGGYGRYQGTWIPFENAVELAQVYNVAELLSPLFDYIAPPPMTSLASASTPNSGNSQFYGGTSASSSRMIPAMSHDGQSAAAILGNAARDQHQQLQQQQQQQQQHNYGEQSDIGNSSSGLTPSGDSASRKRARDSNGNEELKRPKFETGRSSWVNLNGSIGLDGLEAIANGAGGSSSTGGNGGGDGDSRKLKRSSKISGDQTIRLLEDPQRTAQHKATIKAIFSMEPDTPNATRPDLSTLFPTDLDPDTPIDDNDHTALHWASALARLPIVEAFVQAGSDVYKGNNVGETPLIRAVLVTNNSEQDTFPRLLEILGSSLRTVDDASRTVLHHVALVAGVKGRASSARYYLESILEYLSRNEEGRFGDLIDAQDIHGDTALNIAARVGNRGLVRMLIETGADKVRPNKLGLRPRDFGVAGADLEITPAEEVIASLRGSPIVSAPVHKSTEVITGLTTIINSLSSDFAIELKEKSDALDRTRLLLRSAAKNLSEQRNSIALAKEKVALVDEKKLRIKNLERALMEEDTFDWTGRTEVDKTPCRPEVVGAGFTFRGPASTLSNLPPGISIDFETDPLLAPPNLSDTTSFARLTRLTMWYERVISLLRDRVERVKDGIEGNELKLRRIVSSCCGVDESEVEEILEGLLAALEADGTGLDLARVSAFMTRAKDPGVKSFP